MLAEQRPDRPADPSMADLAPTPAAHRITRLDHDRWGATLTWDDRRRDRFPARWLRDNCACPRCRHPQALERTFKFIDHPAPVITAAGLRADGNLEVRFGNDGDVHVSVYARGWLRAHACSEAALAERRPAPRLWDATIATQLPALDYERYLHTDDGLRFWIESLEEHGIVLLRGVPTQPGQLLEVARRIGPVRATNFGEYYDVVSMPNPNASAYTTMGLELHTDLANWYAPPDIQMLCCLKSSAAGGESLFADGFRIAADLRASAPENFALLCRHPVEFRFHDESCDIRASAPTIALDPGGQVRQVRFNNWLRATLSVAEDLVEPMYDALGEFWRRLRDPANHLNLRLEPGWLIAYDNHRVLHGRAPYDARAGERHLQGCYVSREDLESKLRLLDRRRT
jgi:gamma-butyrobetaine dioxygenase